MPKKGEHIAFVLYGDDADNFLGRVKASGLTKSEYCRQAIFSDRIVVVQGLGDIPELIKLLYSSSGTENTDNAIVELEKRLQRITETLDVLNGGGE